MCEVGACRQIRTTNLKGKSQRYVEMEEELLARYIMETAGKTRIE
jgi:hypothetical protein